MGKKGSWFSAVKKVFSHDSRKDKKSKKSKKKSSEKDLEVESKEVQVAVPPIEDVKLTEAENEQNKQAMSLAFATAAAAGAAVAAAQAAFEVVRLTSMPHYPTKTKEELAAIKIQTAFRGYLARRALRALRGLVRLKTMVQGQSVKRQADSTLRCMQTLARLQSQVRQRRIQMSEDNQALQRQLQQKHEKELVKLQAAVGEDWDASLQSKEQIEAKLLQRQEAAFKRERALAYSFSHQQTWKNSSKSANQTFMDPNNPHWGWSWLERWMATRPWEAENIIMNHNDHTSVKSSSKPNYILYDNKPSPVGQKSRRQTIHNSPSTSSKARPSNSKGESSIDDSRSMFSAQSERYRRYSSIAGSSVRDDASVESSPVFPSYMALTSSAKAKSRIMQKTSPSPSSISARKRLSFPASPVGSRRHSGPPKVEI